DVVVWRCSRAFATATVTDSIGSGWFADAAPASCLDAYFHAARAPPVPTTVASSRTDPIRPRRLMSDALLAYPRARFELEPPPPDSPGPAPAPSRATARHSPRRWSRRRPEAARPQRGADAGLYRPHAWARSWRGSVREPQTRRTS